MYVSVCVCVWGGWFCVCGCVCVGVWVGGWVGVWVSGGDWVCVIPSGSSSSGHPDGSAWLSLPHLRPLPHSQRRRNFLPVSGTANHHSQSQSTHGLCTVHYSMYRKLSTLLWKIQLYLIHIKGLASCERSTKIQHKPWFFFMYRYLSLSAYLMQLRVQAL